MIRRCLLAAGSSWLLCAPAAADDHPSVQLEVDPCVDASRDEIRRVVSVELGALLSDASDATGDRTRATAACDGAVVVLRVDDPITGKFLSRTVDVHDAIPRARARLVALAIVELISASWTELEINPQPNVPPSGPRPSLQARRAALASVRAQTDRRAQSRFRLSLLAGGLKFFSKTSLLAGAGLRLAHDRSEPISWMIDAQGHRGSQATTLGPVSTDVLSLGAIAVVQRAWETTSVRLGGGVRGGAVRLSGVPDPMIVAHGSRFWAPWFGALFLGNVEVIVARRFSLDVTLEAGHVLLPVGGLVGSRREVAVDGAWLEARVGVGVFL